jgi:hypothetical protein
MKAIIDIFNLKLRCSVIKYFVPQLIGKLFGKSVYRLQFSSKLCCKIIVKGKTLDNQQLSLTSPFPSHLCFAGISFTRNIRPASRPELAAFAVSFILKMEEAACSEKLVSFHRATWRHIPYYDPLQ